MKELFAEQLKSPPKPFAPGCPQVTDSADRLSALLIRQKELVLATDSSSTGYRAIAVKDGAVTRFSRRKKSLGVRVGNEGRNHGGGSGHRVSVRCWLINANEHFKLRMREIGDPKF